MPRHDLLAFSKLHKAKFNSGDEPGAPLTPDGPGDVYWAPDTDKLYLANNIGDDWQTYILGSGGGSTPTLNSVGDVDAETPTNDQILYWDTGSSTWKAKTLPNFATDFKISKLVDTTVSSEAKGNILVHNGSSWLNLPIGANNQVIQADSAQTVGLKWTVLDLSTVDATYINVTSQSVNPGATPASGKAFIYVKTNDLYIKTDGGSIIGPFLTTAANGALDDLTDVAITSAAKGDILVKSCTDYINLPVGTNGQILTANSATTTGTEWTTIATPQADFELMVWLDMI